MSTLDRRHWHGRCLPGLLLVAALAAPAAGQTVTFTPDIGTFELDPGEQATVHAQVCLPGQVAKADIYLLADTTTSMTPILDQIKANAQQIVTTLLTTPNVDIKVGCGQYRDFPFDPKPFDHQVSPVYNSNVVVGAIQTWFAGGGGDGSEAQFYALHQLATDPAIGFRPDAKRIIVWFGDSPAHDPICAIFNGFGVPTFEITEELVTTALQGAGAGGTTVIAIGVPTGYQQALNDDPTASAEDYPFFCTVGGTNGQADRIATATNGLSTQIIDPVQITAAILDAVNSVLVEVDVDCTVAGPIGSFVQSITPPSYLDVPLPNDPEDQVCLDFDLVLQGPPCGDNQLLHEGAMVMGLNGQPLDELPLSLAQPLCYTPIGLMLVGIRRIEGTPFNGGGADDLLLVQPGIALEVPYDSMPELNIPDDSIYFEFQVYAQCAINDPLNFPADPMKTSPGLIVKLGVNEFGTPYGDGSGLEISLAHPALLGGTFKLACQLSP